MNLLKKCLKYMTIILIPLLCLKMANHYILGQSYHFVIKMIPVYFITALLLFIVLRPRYKKWEPFLFLLPLIYIFPFCLYATTYNDISNSQHPAVLFFWTKIFIQFWSSQHFSCMLFAAYLAKFCVDICLNLRDAVRGKKIIDTAEEDAPPVTNTQKKEITP